MAIKVSFAKNDQVNDLLKKLMYSDLQHLSIDITTDDIAVGRKDILVDFALQENNSQFNYVLDEAMLGKFEHKNKILLVGVFEEKSIIGVWLCDDNIDVGKVVLGIN